MTLKFQPQPGMVLICDFRGFEKPEMVKRRPVVILASNRDTLQRVTVIPLSHTPPRRYQIWHYRVAGPLKPLDEGPAIWAKCDLLYTLSTARLGLIRIEGRRYGPLRLAAPDFRAIRRAAVASLGSL